MAWLLRGLKAQHSLKRDACGDRDLLGDSDAIQNFPSFECLKCPCEVAGVNPVHRRTRADDRVEAEDRLFWMFIRQPLHHVDLSAHRKDGTCGGGLDALPDEISRSRFLRCIHDLHGALGMHDDMNTRVAKPRQFDLFDGKPLVH